MYLDTLINLLMRGFITSIIILLCCYAIMAQSGATTGTIIGSVKDSQDAVISGAAINIKQLETNLTRATQTGKDGTFQMPQLPPGRYQITAQVEGFNNGVETLLLNIGTTALIEFQLTVSSGNDVIEVAARRVLDQDKTENSTIINRNSISNLPTQQRNFLGFALTTARVVSDRTPDTGITSGSGLSINGQPGRFNNITIDGLDNNDIASGSVRSTFAQDAVREFQVVSDGFSAEFGRALSGIINIVTQSGGNQLHGSLFLFNRNDQTSARKVFNAIEQPFAQYQFGSVIGGPIQRDRTFFFASFERLTGGLNQLITIDDRVISAARRQGFAVRNGIIPYSIGTTTTLVKIDGKLSTNNSYWFRYNGGFSYNGSFEPNAGGTISETNGGTQRLSDNSFAFNNTYINAPLHLINETRFLYGRRDQRLDGIVDNEPEVNISGFGMFGRSTILPQPRLENIYQFIDNLSLSRSNHQIKFGVNLQLITAPKDRNALTVASIGNAVFTDLNFSDLFQIPNLPILSSLQAFDPLSRTAQQRAFLNLAAQLLPTMVPDFPRNVPLADIPLPLFYGQGFGNNNIELNAQNLSLFFQDDIKLRRNLLLKAGLRYDLNRTKFAPTNAGNFSPRLAFSYTPFPNTRPNLRLRAGYGIFVGIPAIGPVAQAAVFQNGLRVLVLPPPYSVLPFLLPNYHFPVSTTVPTNVPEVPQYAFAFQYQNNARNSYTHQANLAIDYAVSSETELSIVYNYLRGIKLFGRREINPVVRPIPGDPLNSFVRGRIDPARGSVLLLENANDSYYHGLTVTVQQRFNKRLEFLASYTLAKAIDNISGGLINDVFDGANDPLQPGLERGLALTDLRNRLIFSGVWSLDYTKHPLLRDFQLSTIINIFSGRPYNVIAGEDLNMNNSGGDRPLGLGRNTGITQGFNNVDLRLQRKVALNDRVRIDGYVEIFNLFNRTNLDPYMSNNAFGRDAQGNFNLPPKQGNRFILPKGRYQRAFSQRQVQLGFRLSF